MDIGVGLALVLADDPLGCGGSLGNLEGFCGIFEELEVLLDEKTSKLTLFAVLCGGNTIGVSLTYDSDVSGTVRNSWNFFSTWRTWPELYGTDLRPVSGISYVPGHVRNWSLCVCLLCMLYAIFASEILGAVGPHVGLAVLKISGAFVLVK